MNDEVRVLLYRIDEISSEHPQHRNAIRWVSGYYEIKAPMKKRKADIIDTKPSIQTQVTKVGMNQNQELITM
jgi:hypothetical protein